MSYAPAEREEVQKIRYSINFPDSLIKSNKSLFITIYQEILYYIEKIIINTKAGEIINRVKPTRYHNYTIKFEVDKEYKYFFLSQLNLLKMKYMEYGIFFFEIKPK